MHHSRTIPKSYGKFVQITQRQAANEVVSFFRVTILSSDGARDNAAMARVGDEKKNRRLSEKEEAKPFHWLDEGGNVTWRSVSTKHVEVHAADLLRLFIAQGQQKARSILQE